MTETSKVYDRLLDVFRRVFDDSDLTIGPETVADDIEDWDSLTHIQLLVAVEKEFGIRFNTGEVAGLANVAQLVALIAERTSG